MHFSLLQRQPTSLTITVTKFFPSPSYLTRVVQGQNECYFLSSRLLRRWLSFCYYLLYLCAECHYKKWKRCGIEFHESNVGLNEGEASKATRPFSCQAELSFFFRYFYCKAILFCLLLIMALAHLLFDLLDYKCSKTWKIQAMVTQGDCHSFSINCNG